MNIIIIEKNTDCKNNPIPCIIKEKMDIYSSSKKKKEIKNGYLLLLSSLKYFYKLDNIALSYNTNGKPFMAMKGPYFNISHSHDLFGVALSFEEIGLDIELCQTPKLSLFDYSSHLLNENDYTFLDHKNDLNKAFSQVFTIKEAYIKYLGESIFLGLNKIIINYETHEIQFLDYKKAFFQSFFFEGYVITVVSDTPKVYTIYKKDGETYEIL